MATRTAMASLCEKNCIQVTACYVNCHKFVTFKARRNNNIKQNKISLKIMRFLFFTLSVSAVDCLDFAVCREIAWIDWARNIQCCKNSIE